MLLPIFTSFIMLLCYSCYYDAREIDFQWSLPFTIAEADFFFMYILLKLQDLDMVWNWNARWCHQFGHIVGVFDVIKMRNDVNIQLQLQRGKFSFISFLEPVLFVHNFWPVNSDWLSKWTICVCAEVHFRGLTYFKICKCKWSFGALWQNFLKITQSILETLNKSSRRRNILSFPNLPER